LDFRNGNRDKLFGQSNSKGIYAESEGINVVREGDSITFTLTEVLVNEIVDYICSFHPTMKGGNSNRRMIGKRENYFLNKKARTKSTGFIVTNR